MCLVQGHARLVTFQNMSTCRHIIIINLVIIKLACIFIYMNTLTTDNVIKSYLPEEKSSLQVHEFLAEYTTQGI